MVLEEHLYVGEIYQWQSQSIQALAGQPSAATVYIFYIWVQFTNYMVTTSVCMSDNMEGQLR